MASGSLWEHDGIEYYRIDDVGSMDPFLMAVVSDSDLWMFVSSTGALTAGRIDADRAFFPYETDDRLHRSVGTTGPVTVVARIREGRREVWRPFGPQQTAHAARSIAKSVLGDRLIIEEHHSIWQLTYRATWAPSDGNGWVRSVELANDASADASYEVLDGFLDVMPAGVDAHTEMTLSNLVDAYKRSEVGPWGTLAVFNLEALITDRAEPAEALTATTVWSAGFEGAAIDLDSRAVDNMLRGRTARPSTLVTGRPGAYLLRGPIDLPASGAVSWHLIADTDRTHAQVEGAVHMAGLPDAVDRLTADIDAGSSRLRALLAGADGFQHTGSDVADAHHLSNVLFNSMRGGVFPFEHRVPVADFVAFFASRNREVFERQREWLGALHPDVAIDDLRIAARASGDADAERLVLEYLPLTFSRRHGDPSRPWNRFSISVRTDVGDQVLSYEGNWRDIFQNWEALLLSYPAYLPNVVAKFLNASNLDGFNPYRISRAGIDWEVPDPHDPWSHIGYWGDHQIVYLMRLLEAWDRFDPGAIGDWFDRSVFTYADIPYILVDHEAMVDDPRNTIVYDDERALEIDRRCARIGADGRLFTDLDGSLLRVGLLEKLIVPALAKLSCFVPDGGIWLNTQRPEWNDANNALAGPGLSMVTLFHLRRYLGLLGGWIGRTQLDSVAMTASVADWLADVTDILEHHTGGADLVDDHERRVILDALGRSGSTHRNRVRSGNGLQATDVTTSAIRHLCTLAGEHLDRTIGSARRSDGLYHSYNRLSFPTEATARVDQLGPMLEGQVAILSSGILGAADAAAVVGALFESDIYRADQQTFMLYPATELRPFLDRNSVPLPSIEQLRGHDDLVRHVFDIDRRGRHHIRPEFTNANALERWMTHRAIPDDVRRTVLDIYEDVFDHRSFTGRSGSMYGYEGLGSVYWHMVAKLLLAVQETYWTAVDRNESDVAVADLAAAYRRIRSGLGFEKDPDSYGAIPTDCYSHTPAHAGAQQPGMTGQVKEEVLTRFGELGFRVIDGCVALMPGLLRPDEVFPTRPDGGFGQTKLSICGVPTTIECGTGDAVTIRRSDGSTGLLSGLVLDAAHSQAVFARLGAIATIRWTIGDATMRRWKDGSRP